MAGYWLGGNLSRSKFVGRQFVILPSPGCWEAMCREAICRSKCVRNQSVGSQLSPNRENMGYLQFKKTAGGEYEK